MLRTLIGFISLIAVAAFVSAESLPDYQDPSMEEIKVQKDKMEEASKNPLAVGDQKKKAIKSLEESRSVSKNAIKYDEPTAENIEEQKTTLKKAITEADELVSKGETAHITDDFKKTLNDIKTRQINPNFKLPSFIEIEKSRAYMAKAMDDAQEFSVATDIPQESGTLFIMVSFSMSDELLRDYDEEARKVGASLILRGLVNDDFKATLDKIYSISKGKESAFSIDPTLYKRLGAETVPTFVLAPNGVPPCTPTGCDTPDYIKAHGAVSLRYFLDLVTRQGRENEVVAAKEYLNAYSY